MSNTDQTYYLVVDFEATCADDRTIPPNQMEIIEIGAVMVDAATLQPVGEFQTFVRPVRHPALTRFCRELTSIVQKDVDDAPGFPEALTSFRKWAYGHPGFVFCSWGDYDRKQLALDCERYRVPYPFGHGHINLKAAFSSAQRLSKKLGMAKALQMAGIELGGTHHRGIDDARNIAKLLGFIFGNQRIGVVSKGLQRT